MKANLSNKIKDPSFNNYKEQLERVQSLLYDEEKELETWQIGLLESFERRLTNTFITPLTELQLKKLEEIEAT